MAARLSGHDQLPSAWSANHSLVARCIGSWCDVDTTMPYASASAAFVPPSSTKNELPGFGYPGHMAGHKKLAWWAREGEEETPD